MSCLLQNGVPTLAQVFRHACQLLIFTKYWVFPLDQLSLCSGLTVYFCTVLFLLQFTFHKSRSYSTEIYVTTLFCCGLHHCVNSQLLQLLSRLSPYLYQIWLCGKTRYGSLYCNQLACAGISANASPPASQC